MVRQLKIAELTKSLYIYQKSGLSHCKDARVLPRKLPVFWF